MHPHRQFVGRTTQQSAVPMPSSFAIAPRALPPVHGTRLSHPIFAPFSLRRKKMLHHFTFWPDKAPPLWYNTRHQDFGQSSQPFDTPFRAVRPSRLRRPVTASPSSQRATAVLAVPLLSVENSYRRPSSCPAVPFVSAALYYGPHRRRFRSTASASIGVHLRLRSRCCCNPRPPSLPFPCRPFVLARMRALGSQPSPSFGCGSFVIGAICAICGSPSSPFVSALHIDHSRKQL